MLVELCITIMIGILMGLLTHTKRNKHIKKPKINKTSWNPGFLLDCAFGSIAALVGVIVAAPIETERLILIAILAGYAGEGLIRKMSDANLDANERINRKIKADLTKEIKIDEPKEK